MRAHRRKGPDRRRFTLVAAVTLGLVFVAVGATGWIDAQRYSSVTAGVQTIGVVIALGLAVTTLRADSRDRQVDRVLALHTEFMTGDIWAARRRLGDHLRAQGGDGKIRALSRDDLSAEAQVAGYAGEPNHSTRADADLLLRFFERANAARRTGALHESLLAELIGKHSIWWNRAFTVERIWVTRKGLSELAGWCDDYVAREREHRAELADWRLPMDRDFGVPLDT